jgi:hypothetical protein
MLVTDQDITFTRTGFQEVKGWCQDEAAYLTCCLLAKQAELGHAGAVLEIGVFEGKYLSVLYNWARRSGYPVAGVDTFQWSSADGVLETFKRIFGAIDGLRLMKADSTTLDVKTIQSLLGGRNPAFISVDGDHTAKAVLSDMTIAENVLTNGGIVALDDFLNPHAIGVSEGAYRYLLQPNSRLRPFAWVANKLLVAEPAFHEQYRSAIEAFFDERPDLPVAAQFRKREKEGRHWVEQRLLDAPVLIV